MKWDTVRYPTKCHTELACGSGARMSGQGQAAVVRASGLVGALVGCLAVSVPAQPRTPDPPIQIDGGVVVGHAVLGRIALGRLFNALAPLGLQVAGGDSQPQQVTLTEIRYCGIDTASRARLLALATLGATAPVGGGVPGPLITTEADCDASLATVLRARAIAGGLVARIEVEWQPWDLRFRVSEARSAGTLPVGLVGQEFTVPTAPLDLTIGARELPLALSLRFAHSAIVVGLQTVGPPGASPRLTPGAMVSPDLRLFVSLASLNWIAKDYFKDGQPLKVTGSGLASDLELTSLRVDAPQDNTLLVTGVATSSDQAAFDIKAALAGTDLTVASVEVAPRLRQCGGLDPLEALGCQTENAVHTAAALTLGPLLTGLFHDQTVRELSRLQPIPVRLGALRCDIRVFLDQISVRHKELEVVARLGIERP